MPTVWSHFCLIWQLCLSLRDVFNLRLFKKSLYFLYLFGGKEIFFPKLSCSLCFAFCWPKLDLMLIHKLVTSKGHGIPKIKGSSALTAHWNHWENVKKKKILDPNPRACDLIGLGCSQGTQSLKTFPGDSNVQPFKNHCLRLIIWRWNVAGESTTMTTIILLKSFWQKESLPYNGATMSRSLPDLQGKHN